MQPVSTSELVLALCAEGPRIMRKKLENLIAGGHIVPPSLVGPIRVWLPVLSNTYAECSRSSTRQKPREAANE
jgi:hypothetical protein